MIQSIQSITKTYELGTVGDDDLKELGWKVPSCDAEVASEDGSDYCGARAVYVVKVTTAREGDRRRVNYVGMCQRHISRQYQRWFHLIKCTCDNRSWLDRASCPLHSEPQIFLP